MYCKKKWKCRRSKHTDCQTCPDLSPTDQYLRACRLLLIAIFEPDLYEQYRQLRNQEKLNLE
jgi:hypothetical protein